MGTSTQVSSGMLHCRGELWCIDCFGTKTRMEDLSTFSCRISGLMLFKTTAPVTPTSQHDNVSSRALRCCGRAEPRLKPSSTESARAWMFTFGLCGKSDDTLVWHQISVQAFQSFHVRSRDGPLSQLLQTGRFELSTAESWGGILSHSRLEVIPFEWKDLRWFSGS